MRGESQDEELSQSNLLSRNITIMREYYRADLDEDGYPELNMIVRVGQYIIHKEPVEDNDFSYWVPYRIPHEFLGESQADKLMNIQDLKTSFWRSTNDAAAYASRPRVAYDHRAASQHQSRPWAIFCARNRALPFVPLDPKGLAVSHNLRRRDYARAESSSVGR